MPQRFIARRSRDRHAFGRDDQRLGQVRDEDAVDEEAGRVVDENRRLADRPASATAVASEASSLRAPADDLDQRHLRHGVEEVQADDALGMRVASAISETRSELVLVASTRVGLRQPVELREDVALRLHRLQHRFDDEVGQLQARPFGRGADAVERVSRGELVDPPAATSSSSIFWMRPSAAADGGGVHFDEPHGDAGADQRVDDPRAHRAAADDGGVLHLRGLARSAPRSRASSRPA